jgi:hypothetical protein
MIDQSGDEDRAGWFNGAAIAGSPAVIREAFA